jgi:hypothetical protein
VDEVMPAARLPTVERREPCESRGSRTVLGAPGGEIPPGDSSFATEQFNASSCHCLVCTVSDQNGGGWRSSRGSPPLVTGVALQANFRQM